MTGQATPTNQVHSPFLDRYVSCVEIDPEDDERARITFAFPTVGDKFSRGEADGTCAALVNHIETSYPNAKATQLVGAGHSNNIDSFTLHVRGKPAITHLQQVVESKASSEGAVLS